MLNAPGGPPTPAPRLSDVARQSKLKGGPETGTAPVQGSGDASSWQPVDPLVQAAFSKSLDGASIPQWRLTNYRGKTRLLVTTNSEEAVFNALSAAARAIRDLSDRGREASIEIVLTSSSHEPAGTFEMTPDQARQLVNGTVAIGDYFVKNVIL
jgi:hypothetical protein